MYPIVMLVAGMILLVIFFWRVPFNLSIKQRVQVIMISSLLVGLTLLLAALYTWMIAALAFMGLLLLFIVVLGKQFEIDEWEEEQMEETEGHSEEGEPVFSFSTVPEKKLSETELAAMLEEVGQEQPLPSNESEENQPITQSEETSMEESTMALDEKGDVEEDEFDFFEHRPKSLLTEEETDSIEEDEDLGISRLGLASSMEESHEESNDYDLPIRVAPEDDWMSEESPLHRDETNEENLASYDQKNTEEDFVSARQRLFEELENDDKKD
ncbi:hypothetical protein PQ478_16615 [Alkalihalophilus pseudofirmus]|uniref:hypothetical protein n=1 Tax=Alkalihalophilus pseudofirmus TaxID=79885 RepID=UPI00259B8B3D|nr:hypothetical protein [Alkalihalophilus pseudofirmus]WEG16115.1 hypothetical protein PQ478_16615 [Alkalihalophilus pseudofirmus]